MSRRSRFLLAGALIPGVCLVLLTVLRLCGLLIPYSVPTGGMSPAVSPGDHIVMEGITFLFRPPRRGDIVVFKADGIGSFSPDSKIIKRIAGEPGDHVRIAHERLFINDKLVSLSNALGGIAYYLPPSSMSSQNEATVPSGCYFVLGDNSTNSYDSRFWGGLPRENIIGRVSFCNWPPKRAGRVK